MEGSSVGAPIISVRSLDGCAIRDCRSLNKGYFVDLHGCFFGNYPRSLLAP